MSERVLKVAIVGHTNTGKTSLLRTLTRDVTFGEVSDRPAVTRDVAGAVMLVDGRPLIELYDTPGLEDSIALLEHLESLRRGREEDGVEVIQRFLESSEAHDRFAQEAKALRQLLRCDAALYVIDARDRVLSKHRDELTILAMAARPIVPVLNFTARPEAQTRLWRDQLSRTNLHAVAEFDTIVLDALSEQRLYEKMQTLLDPFRDTLDALIADRRRLREQLVESSAALLADLLIDAAAFRLRVPTDNQNEVDQALTTLKDAIRAREQACVRSLLELHRFSPDDCDAADIPLEDGRWGSDLFSPEAMREFGIRTGSAAAAGAVTGLAIDVAVGGISLGAAAATGAAIGAMLGAGRTHGRRLLDRLRGWAELRCSDQTLQLLLNRQVVLIRALLARGHASQNPVHLAPNASATPEKQRWSIPEPIRRARANPDWSKIDKQPGLRVFGGMSRNARDDAEHSLAAMIKPTLSKPPGDPIEMQSR